jgi:hypothetical protein
MMKDNMQNAMTEETKKWEAQRGGVYAVRQMWFIVVRNGKMGDMGQLGAFPHLNVTELSRYSSSSATNLTVVNHQHQPHVA